MNRFLHISIVWGETQKSTSQLQPIFDLAADWLAYGDSNWIIYTNESVATWEGRILAVLNTTTDTFFMSEIANVHGTGGYLAQWIWEWLRKPRIDSSLYGMLLPPKP